MEMIDLAVWEFRASEQGIAIRVRAEPLPYCDSEVLFGPSISIGVEPSSSHLCKTSLHVPTYVATNLTAL